MSKGSQSPGAPRKVEQRQASDAGPVFRWRGLLAWCLPLTAAGFLVFFRLSEVVGLHRDEAVFGLFAEQIRDGLRPIRGVFNVYTAPLHSYLIAGCFELFGRSVWSLRVSGAVLNLVALLACADLVRRVAPGRAVWLLWLLGSFPAFVVFARIAGENYALNPLFLFGGIWCYHVLGSPGRSRWLRRLGQALAGLMFAWGAWNHVVFVPTAAAVVLAYLVAARGRIRDILRSVPCFLLGAVLGAAPRLYGIIVLGHELLPPSPPEGSAPAPLWGATLNMLYTLGGGGLYARACGEVLVNLGWVLPVALLASGSFWVQRMASPEKRRLWKYIGLCAVASFFGSWLITPAYTLGARVWLLPLWFVPLLLCLALSESNRPLRWGIGAALVAVNIAAVGINYFHNFLEDGGIAKEKVYVGGRSDNSGDFVDMRPLVQKLRAIPGETIFIGDYNPYRLGFLLPQTRSGRLGTVDELMKDPRMARPDSLVILYREPGEEYAPYRTVRRYGRVLIAKDLGLDAGNFRICRLVEIRPEADSGR